MSSLADFHFLPWQAEFLRSVLVDGARAVAIRGGIRSGKSVAKVYLAATLCLSRPGCLGYLVMDTFGNSRDVHGPICDDILPSTGAVWSASTREWRWPNGSVLRLRAYFREATQTQAKNPFEGNTVHFILVDEAGKFSNREVWEKANERCSQAVKDLNGNVCDPVVVLSGFPEDPCWWVEAIREAESKGLKTAEFYPRTTENVSNLAAGYIETIAQTHSADEVEALIHNRPRPRVGQVYSNWSPTPWPNGNLIARPVDRSRPTICSIDFGFRFPSALLIQHWDDIGCDVIVDEVAPDDVLTPDLARLIRAKGYNLQGLCGDPAGGARSAQTGRSDIDILAQPPDKGGLGLRMQVVTDPRKRDLKAGIIRVRRQIEAGGQRRLLMLQSLWDDGIRDSKNRNIAAAIQSYRYSEKGDGLPVKDGRHDHACFVAGTLIWTAEGNRPIETIRPGDLVWTRQGLRPVLDAACTSLDADVFRLETSAVDLVGTGNHPVWTEKGWVRLDALRYSGMVTVCLQSTVKRSSSKDGPTAGIPTTLSGGHGCTSALLAGRDGPAISTETSTPRRTGRSRRATTSTTKTATPSTTTSPIWRRSPRVTITDSTRRNSTTTPSSSLGDGLTSTGFAPSQQSGTAAKRDESGTASMAASPTRAASSTSGHVTDAERPTRPDTSVGTASVRTPARLRGGLRRAWIRLIDRVSSAVRPFGSTNTSTPRLVPASVRRVSPAGSGVPVFNLTVDDAHEYFANGILVSNCDALRYYILRYHWYEEGEAPRLSVYSPSSNDVKPAASKLIGGHRPWAAAKR